MSLVGAQAGTGALGTHLMAVLVLDSAEPILEMGHGAKERRGRRKPEERVTHLPRAFTHLSLIGVIRGC